MDVKYSDEVCLVKGGNTPFLLRSTNSVLRNRLGSQPSRDNVDAFKLVGDCYAFGLMDLVDVIVACNQQDSFLGGCSWRDIVVV
jgi:hypothetical protein